MERIDTREISLREVVRIVDDLNDDDVATVAQESSMINRLRGVIMLWAGEDPGYYAFDNIGDVYDYLGVKYRKDGDWVYSEFEPEFMEEKVNGST